MSQAPRETALALGIFLRSFLVQASWNFKRMQNLGFFFMLLPALARRSPRGSTELAQASLKHLQFFNTHPYYAGLVAGVVAAEEVRRGDAALAAGLKRSLMCSLGGIGDEFFWAHLKPLAALVALPLALAGHTAAPVILLLVFNGPHLAARWWGVSTALRRGREIVAVLQSRRLTRWIAPFALMIAALAGCTAVLLSGWPPGATFRGRSLPQVAPGSALFLASILVQARGITLERVLLGLSAVALLAGVAGVVAP